MATSNASNIDAPKTCLYVIAGKIKLIAHHPTKDRIAKNIMFINNSVENSISAFILLYDIVYE